MRPLLYSINVTLDGCVDHRAGIAPDEEMHRHHTENLKRADALILGRVTYEMMEEAFRLSTRTVVMPDWTEPFARTMDAAKKYVVSRTLERVDWNAELVHGDTVRDALAYVQFDAEALISNFRKKVSRATSLSRTEANAFIADYIAGLAGYTYLEGPTR